MASILAALVTLFAAVYSQSDDGSGAFGKWGRNSPYNLPFYSYTLDQTTDPIAVAYNNDQTQNPAPITNATNHLFQFGNDKYVMIASNYGFTQMRTDETGPKFLNDFNRRNSQFGGSNAYLRANNDTFLSTFYTGQHPSTVVNRNYGFYYRNYHTRNTLNNLSLNHTVITPFGNDTVSISKIVITNDGNMDYNNLKYIEVYSNTMYQLTTDATGVLSEERREYQIQNYNVSYRNMNNLDQSGLLSQTLFKHNNNASGNTQWLWDETPPITFVSTVGLNNSAINIKHGCELDKFYGNYGAESPNFTVECNGNNNIKHTGLVLELSNINIAPHQQMTFYLIYGYVYDMTEIKAYIQKYNDLNVLNNLMQNTAEKWSKDAMIFNTNNTKYEWMSRELLWDYGYLRSALTFYNLFDEYIIDQGTDYRYHLGFQGAFRDPLQHSLPLIYTNPNYAKSILRYSMKEIIAPFNDTKRSQNFPYGLQGNGEILQTTNASKPSDLELYLLFVASEYILATKDIEFLNEKISLNIFGGNNREYSVLDCLLQCYDFLRKHISVGKHGIIRLQTGDWNDGIIFGKGDPDATIKYGESALNTALALYALPKFQQILEMIEYSLPDLPVFIENQTLVLRNVLFNGEYINRAWIPDSINGNEGTWLGSLSDGQMYLFPQVWTLLCGEKCLSKDKIEIIINNIDKRLRNNASIGAIMLANSTQLQNLGVGGNGGSWYAMNHPLIMGLSLFNSTMAFDEWVRNSFYSKANEYPLFWPNIWSSGDSWDSYLVSSTNPKAVGASLWVNYPVFCGHAHAWPLYSFVNGIIGIRFEKNKLVMQPSLEREFGAFEFKTQLVSVRRDESGNYFGHYSPKQFIGDMFIVQVKLDRNYVYTESIQVSPNSQSIAWQFSTDKEELLVYLL